jgi:predicted nucleic acid-binding protein
MRRRFGRDRGTLSALLKALEGHLAYFDLSPVDDRVLDAAILLIERYALRAADALHLAAAVLLSRDIGRRQLRFATLDAEQAAAATAAGLRVLRLD